MAQETLSIILKAVDSASPVLKNFSGTLNTVSSKLSNVRDELKKFSNEIDSAMKYATKLTGALIGVVSGSTYFAANVEKAFQNARTMMEMTDSQAKQIQSSIQELSLASGKSLQELGDALYMLGSASVKATDSIDVLKATTISSIAGATDISTTFNSAISIINAYGMSMKDLSTVYAMQFEAVKKGLLNYEELARDFGTLIPAARNLGVSLKEALAGYAALTTAGFRSSEAANAAEGAFRDIMQQADKFQELGVKIYDSKGQFVGLTAVVEQLRKRLDGLTDDQKRIAVQQLALSETGSRALLTWVNSYDKYLDVLSGIRGDTEALNDVYKTQTQSISFLLDRLKASIGLLNMAFFNAMRSGIVNFLNQAINTIRALTIWVGKNQETVSQLVWTLLRIGAIAIGVLASLKVLSQAAQVGTFLLNPYVLALLGVAAALYKLWQTKNEGKNFADFIQWLWNQLVTFFTGLIQWVASVDWAGIFGKFFGFFEWIWNGLSTGFRTVWEWTVTGLDWVWENILVPIGTGIWNVVSTAWEWIVNGLTWIWDSILEPVGKGIWNVLTSTWEWIVNGIDWLWNDILEPAGKGVWNALRTSWEWIVNGVEWYWDNVVMPLSNGILNAFKTSWEWIVNGAEWYWNNIVKPLGEGIWNAFTTSWQWIVNGLEWLWNNVVKPLNEGVWNSLKTSWEWIINGLEWLWNNVLVSISKGIWNSLKTTWEWIINGIDWIKDNVLVPLAKGTFKLAKVTWEWVISGLDWVRDKIIDPLAKGTFALAKATWEWIVKGADKLWNDIVVKAVNGTFKLADATWNWVVKGLETVAKAIEYFNTTVKTTWQITVEWFENTMNKVGQKELKKAQIAQQTLNDQNLPWWQKMLIFIGLYGNTGYAEGGYTGDGTAFSIAGVVHRGEYVLPAWLVKSYPDVIASLERIRQRGFQSGGSDVPVATGISEETKQSNDWIKQLSDMVLGIGDILTNMGSDMKMILESPAMKELPEYLSQYSDTLSSLTNATYDIGDTAEMIKKDNEKQSYGFGNFLNSLREAFSNLKMIFPELEFYSSAFQLALNSVNLLGSSTADIFAGLKANISSFFAANALAIGQALLSVASQSQVLMAVLNPITTVVRGFHSS